MSSAILGEGLVKTYGTTRALDGLDLEVREGTVLGLLGPNGAGKTTAVRLFTTLLVPDSGRAFVGGHDVVRDPRAVRRVMGMSGQYAAVDENLTGRQNLQLLGRLHHLGPRAAKLRAGELLERFDLCAAADRPAKTYSGGMNRRLDLAGALVARPRILFLDEPTTGLDPGSRFMAWDLIAGLVRDGVTVLLTTQYLEEADRLAHSVAVVDSGRVIASGAPDDLKAKVGGDRVEVVLQGADQLDDAGAALLRCAGVEPTVDVAEHRLSVPMHNGIGLVDVVRELDVSAVTVVDVAVRRPSMDDVFLTLTGQRAAPSDGKRPEGADR